MKNFEYIAVSSDNSKQTGVIEANDEFEARAKLHKLGFSVLRINETKAQSQNKEEDKKQTEENKNKIVKGLKDKKPGDEDEKLPVFEFHGFDRDGIGTGGTIESSSAVLAYKRLVEEFSIDPEWVVEEKLSPAVKEAKKKNSVDEILDEAYEEGIDIKSPKSNLKQESDEVEAFISKEEQEQIQFEVNEFLPKIIEFISNHSNSLAVADTAELNKKIQEVEKIKRSNNVKFIESELKTLLEKFRSLIEDDELLEKINENERKLVDDIDSYVGFGAKSIISEKIISFLEKFEFLKKLAKKIKEKTDLRRSNPELYKQKQKIGRYFRQFYHHLKLIFHSKGEERGRRIRAAKKSLKLIFYAYKSYSSVKEGLSEKKTNFRKKAKKRALPIFKEIRSFTGWVLGIYIFYFILLEISIKKGLLIDVYPSFYTLNSKLLISFVLLFFMINFLLLLKIKIFKTSLVYNIISLPVLLVMVFLFYNNF